MKVKALEGDTVDSLCFRYYGTTQGVTEKVLDANPGLCQQVFLDAGQEVEMPEPEKKKREMIQLWGGLAVSTIQTGITEQVIAWLFDHLPTVYAVGAAVSISALMSLYDGRTTGSDRNGIAGVRRSCHGRGRVVALLRFS
ncbi:Tail protein X (GpX) [Escherichia coli]|uniref:Tail protein X (GpX) n=12 Tax=Enterobacteriaceae TaxID=543 RepID=A0A376KHT5_ECOLX|nr:Tail protein X (GpX) [Escherichia coli]